MMEQRELESRIKQLTKCVASNEPPESALKLLDTLKKEASPTEEQLRVGFHGFLFYSSGGNLQPASVSRNAMRSDTRGCDAPK